MNVKIDPKLLAAVALAVDPKDHRPCMHNVTVSVTDHRMTLVASNGALMMFAYQNADTGHLAPVALPPSMVTPASKARSLNLDVSDPRTLTLILDGTATLQARRDHECMPATWPGLLVDTLPREAGNRPPAHLSATNLALVARAAKMLTGRYGELSFRQISGRHIIWPARRSDFGALMQDASPHEDPPYWLPVS